MLFAVDVGNTQTHLGVFDDSELVVHWRFATEPSATSDELAVTISGLLALQGLEPGRLDGAITSTVVPQLGPEYERMCERLIRLVNAVAAYDRARGACVAVDFGTSTNFDVVSAAGEYLGGVIGPGVEISMEALTERTAKLPRIDLSEPGRAIGKNTQEAMEAGFVHGFAGLVDGIASRVSDQLGGDATFIATGGLAAAIVPFCDSIDEVDDLLTLTGLRLIYDRNG